MMPGTALKTMRTLCQAFQQGGLRYTLRRVYDYAVKWRMYYRLASQATPLKTLFPIREEGSPAYPSLAVFQSLRPALLVDHACGGGANSFARQWADIRLSSGRAVAIWRYLPGMQTYVIELRHSQQRLLIRERSFERISQFILWLSPSKVVYNELVSWPKIDATLLFLQKLPDAELEVWIHDYFCVCPTYTLLDNQGKYCGLPEPAVCATCLPGHRHVPAHTPNDISVWRAQWRNFLKKATRVYVPDASVKHVLGQVYPALDSILQVVPHSPLADWEPLPPPKSGALPVIGVIGHITRHKGAEIVENLVKLLRDHSSGARVVVVGELNSPVTSSKLTVTRAYIHENLPNLVATHGITVGLVPSLCPETFCYTAFEITRLGLPLVCFNLGAQGRRAQEYDKGFIAETMDAEGCLQACLRAHDYTMGQPLSA